MSDLPWVKWFCSDWLSDPCLTKCSPATRGIWKDALDAMILRKHATLKGTTADLARICRCSEAEFETAVAELVRTEAAQAERTNGEHILTCRRLQRELHIKELRRKAGIASGTKRQQHVGTKRATRSASASASAYASVSASESKTTWLSPYATIWTKVMGGSMSFGQAAKHLKPLDSQHGQEKVCKVLEWYLTNTDPQFVSLARFASTFGRWADKANPKPKYVREIEVPDEKPTT